MSKIDDLKNELVEQKYNVRPFVVWQNILSDTIRNVGALKLSQYTQDSGIIMPTFMSINILMICTLRFIYDNLKTTSNKIDGLNMYLSVLAGVLSGIKVFLII